MNADISVTLTYSEEEASEVVRAFLYFTSNVSATREDQDRMSLIRSAIKGAIPPPKPDEPLGLGAVVEDGNGVRWVRANDEGEWFSQSGLDVVTTYAEVAAVRILSDGVVL